MEHQNIVYNETSRNLYDTEIDVISPQLEARLNEISLEVLTDNSLSEYETEDSISETSTILSENNSDTKDENNSDTKDDNNSLTSDFPDVADIMHDMFDEKPEQTGKGSLIDDFADVSSEPMDIIDD